MARFTYGIRKFVVSKTTDKDVPVFAGALCSGKQSALHAEGELL